MAAPPQWGAGGHEKTQASNENMRDKKRAERLAQSKQQHPSNRLGHKASIGSSHSFDVNRSNNGGRSRRRPTQHFSWRSTDFIVLCILLIGVPFLFVLYREVNRIYPTFFPLLTHTLLGRSNLTQPNITDFHFPPFTMNFPLLKQLRKANSKRWGFSHNLTGIDRRQQMSLIEFREMYDGKWPVIITDCVRHWPAFHKWNENYFRQRYGEEMVTMVASHTGKLANGESLALPLSRYLDHLQEGHPNMWTYLQDELFIVKRPELQQDIGVCEFLKEDFFPLFPADVRPWWAFLLWGTAHSHSKLHIDPYNWTGTNAVLKGAKRWHLFPPGHDPLLHVIHNQSSNFPLNCPKYNSDVDTFRSDSLPPDWKAAEPIEFVQNAGELLIIPPGWFHQAYNEQPTLAIAGQLMNRNNYRIILEEIFKGGGIPRGPYSRQLSTWTEEEQVKHIMSHLPENLLTEGRHSTEFILQQLTKKGTPAKQLDGEAEQKMEKEKKKDDVHTDL